MLPPGHEERVELYTRNKGFWQDYLVCRVSGVITFNLVSFLPPNSSSWVSWCPSLLQLLSQSCLQRAQLRPLHVWGRREVTRFSGTSPEAGSGSVAAMDPACLSPLLLPSACHSQLSYSALAPFGTTPLPYSELLDRTLNSLPAVWQTPASSPSPLYLQVWGLGAYGKNMAAHGNRLTTPACPEPEPLEWQLSQ